MNYEQAVNYIHEAAHFGSKLGLDNITKLLDLLGNPQEQLRFVHVTGTNGKGSTSNYIANVLYSAGYKTGLFISPYIEKFGERIQIDFENILEDSLTANVVKVKAAIDYMLENGFNHPTKFEIETAIAMLYFRDSNCDVVVLEVGLGGRLDSTNVISKSLLSVICTIDIDHTGVLGDNIEQIAFEKAGIIKQDCPVLVYGGNPPEVLEVIKKQAETKNATFSVVDFSKIQNIRYKDFSYTFDFEDFKDIHIQMFGEHQINNAVLALQAVLKLRYVLDISDEAIYRGFSNAKWPGRLEILSKDPLVLCDGAHNLQGIRSLKDTLDKYFADKHKIFVMAVMRNKDYSSMIGEIFTMADTAIAVRPDYDRALETIELQHEMEKYCKDVHSFDKIEEGLKFAYSIANKNSIICTFGSLYYIADVKNFVKKQRK